jgi:hypothetical protein
LTALPSKKKTHVFPSNHHALRVGGLRLTLGCCCLESKSALSIPTTGVHPAAEPLSREDALTERLRSLRTRRDQADSSHSGDPPPPYTASSPFTTPARAQPSPPPSCSRVPGLPPAGEDARSSRPSGAGGEDTEGGSRSSGEYDHSLDDLLQPLDLDDDDDHDEDGSDSNDGAGGESSKRVEDLLAKLKADPGAKPPLPTESKSDDSDDDSEGEVMSREVENVISRAMDELKLQGPASPPGDPEAMADRGLTPKADDGSGGADHDLALPTVPQDAADNKKPGASPRLSRPRGNDDGEADLSLPTVPTDLVDPAPTSGQVPSAADDPFESSIQARLAALKGATAPIIRTDALGLPSAPTFRPEDNVRRPPARLGRPGTGGSRAGYTDADQKTWCIVCLEDGTIRCLGCSDDDDGRGGGGDVYCARCWKEMHVGPSAGYDERGHAWEKFDPRRV